MVDCRQVFPTATESNCSSEIRLTWRFRNGRRVSWALRVCRSKSSCYSKRCTGQQQPSNTESRMDDSWGDSRILKVISESVTSGRHAALLLDQAGWHMSPRLNVPENITIVPLPPKCPELNPQENIWQFMRDNRLSNRVFSSYENIVDHCCYAWKQTR